MTSRSQMIRRLDRDYPTWEHRYNALTEPSPSPPKGVSAVTLIFSALGLALVGGAVYMASKPSTPSAPARGTGSGVGRGGGAPSAPRPGGAPAAPASAAGRAPSAPRPSGGGGGSAADASAVGPATSLADAATPGSWTSGGGSPSGGPDVIIDPSTVPDAGAGASAADANAVGQGFANPTPGS